MLLKKIVDNARLLVIYWLLVGTLTFVTGFTGYIFLNILEGGWVVEILKTHFAATVFLPFSAIGALFIVALFKYTSNEPIEFKALGLEFKGIAGPVILWVICFLAFITGIKLLW